MFYFVAEEKVGCVIINISISIEKLDEYIFLFQTYRNVRELFLSRITKITNLIQLCTLTWSRSLKHVFACIVSFFS